MNFIVGLPKSEGFDAVLGFYRPYQVPKKIGPNVAYC